MTSRRSRIQLRPNIRPSRGNPTSDNCKENRKKALINSECSEAPKTLGKYRNTSKETCTRNVCAPKLCVDVNPEPQNDQTTLMNNSEHYFSSSSKSNLAFESCIENHDNAAVETAAADEGVSCTVNNLAFESFIENHDNAAVETAADDEGVSCTVNNLAFEPCTENRDNDTINTAAAENVSCIGKSMTTTAVVHRPSLPLGQPGTHTDCKHSVKPSKRRICVKPVPNLKKPKQTKPGGAITTKKYLQNARNKSSSLKKSTISMGNSNKSDSTTVSSSHKRDIACQNVDSSVFLSKNIGKSDKEVCNKKQNKKHLKPEQNKLKMIDFIYWNPDENSTQESTIESETGGEQDSQPLCVNEAAVENATACTDNPPEAPSNEDAATVCERETDDTNDEVNCADTGGSAFVPRLMIDANGNIILDENSLVIERTVLHGQIQSEPIFNDKEATYSSFRRKAAARGWPKQETAKFYKALSVVGTDFSLMSRLFPNRSRHELKLKFKKEEKSNLNLINKALETPPLFDLTLFESSAEDEVDAELNNIDVTTSKNNKRRKMSLEESKNEESDDESIILDVKKPRRRRIPRTYDASDSEEESSTQVPPQPVLSTSSDSVKTYPSRSEDSLLSQDNENNENTNYGIYQESPTFEVECFVEENSGSVCVESADCDQTKLLAVSTGSNSSAHNSKRLTETSRVEDSCETLSPRKESNGPYSKTVTVTKLLDMMNEHKSGNETNEISTLCVGGEINVCKDLQGQNKKSKCKSKHKKMKNSKAVKSKQNIVSNVDDTLENDHAVRKDYDCEIPFTSHGLMIIGPKNEKKLLFPKSLISSSETCFKSCAGPMEVCASELGKENREKQSSSQTTCGSSINEHILSSVLPDSTEVNNIEKSDKIVLFADNGQGEERVVHVFLAHPCSL